MTQVEKIKAEGIKSQFLSEEWVMDFTGYARKTIQTLRSAGSKKIPPAKKVGAKWMYPVKEFEKWLENQPTQSGVA